MKGKNWFKKWGLPTSIVILVALMPVWGCGAADKSSQPIPSVRDLGRAFVEVAKKVQPSVVSVRSEKQLPLLLPWRGLEKISLKERPLKISLKVMGGDHR